MPQEFEYYRLRLPKPLLRDAADLALAYDESTNEFLKQCVDRYVRELFENTEIQETILKMRALRAARSAAA